MDHKELQYTCDQYLNKNQTMKPGQLIENNMRSIIL